MALIAVIVVLVVIAAILAGIYNSLVQLRVRADSAWSDIDVQLKRRHDLIPNLVETVKGYATHEKGTFENIAKYRSAAMSATTPADRAAAEGQLTGADRVVLSVAPSATAARLKGVSHLSPDVKLWPLPFEALAIRQAEEKAPPAFRAADTNS